MAELSWDVNLPGVFVHAEVEVHVEPLQLYTVPVLVIQQAAQRNQRLPARG